MSIIREDRHGLYVKVGGYVARPIFPAGYQHVYDDGSEYEVGDKVNGRHVYAGSLVKVGDETWFAHGAYKGNPKFASPNSENSYKPHYENWS